MTDPELDDDQLAERVRTGLDALAEAIGDPPAFPGTGPVPARTRTRAYALAAAAVVLVGLAVGAVVWSQRDRPPDERVATGPEVAPVVDRPLEGTRWWLETAEDAGRAVEPQTAQAIGLQIAPRASCTGYERGSCDDGAPVLWAADSCNGISRTVAVEPTAMVLGAVGGPSTLMACSGPFIDLVDGVYAAGRADYEIHGDELTVSRGGAVLTYAASDGPFGPTTGTTIDAGEIGLASYRVVYTDGELRFEKGDTEKDLVQGGSGVGDDPGRINMASESVRGRPYVMATVPKASARVVYEAEGTPHVELEIHEVDSKVSSVVASFVDVLPPAWQLVAYDADGVELHRYGMWPRQDMGAGRSIEEVVAEAGFDDCCRASGARTSFTADGVAMTFGSGPLPPTMPRDPAEGLDDPERLTIASGGSAMAGSIGDQSAIRFDCAETRYEVRAPQASATALPEIAARLSAAAGCPETVVAPG